MSVEQFLQLAQESWPGAILIFMLFVLWRIAKWGETVVVRPLISKLGSYLDKSIDALENNTDRLHQQSEVLTTLLKTKEKEYEAVTKLLELHESEESKFATVNLEKKTDTLNRHNKVFAESAITAIEIWRNHVQDAQDKKALDGIIRDLQAVAKHDQ